MNPGLPERLASGEGSASGHVVRGIDAQRVSETLASDEGEARGRCRRADKNASCTGGGDDDVAPAEGAHRHAELRFRLPDGERERADDTCAGPITVT